MLKFISQSSLGQGGGPCRVSGRTGASSQVVLSLASFSLGLSSSFQAHGGDRRESFLVLLL